MKKKSFSCRLKSKEAKMRKVYEYSYVQIVHLFPTYFLGVSPECIFVIIFPLFQYSIIGYMYIENRLLYTYPCSLSNFTAYFLPYILKSLQHFFIIVMYGPLIIPICIYIRDFY